MRLEACEQIWHGFGVLRRHLFLMMDFDCPLTFRHKKGGVHMRCFWHSLYLFCCQGETLFFIGWSLQSCLDCIQVLHFVFYLLALATLSLLYWVIHVRGSIFCDSCFKFLLIYDYEFFIIICLYCLCLKSRFLFFLLVFFPHMRLCILFKCFRKYTG